MEFEASTRMQDTSVSFGYQLDLPKANLLFKGTGLGFRTWKTGHRGLGPEWACRLKELMEGSLLALGAGGAARGGTRFPGSSC